MNSSILGRKKWKPYYEYRKVKICQRKNKIKRGLFSQTGVWLKPLTHCPVCSPHTNDNRGLKQSKITKFLKQKNITVSNPPINSENYDADGEMEIDTESTPNTQIKPQVHLEPHINEKKEVDEMEIELLSLLIEKLDTKPKPRYNLRKRKTNKTSSLDVSKIKDMETRTSKNKCGKKNKNKKKRDDKYLQVDFSLMFEKMSL